MNRVPMLFIILSVLPAGLRAQDPSSPYAGFQQRAIKALSQEQIDDYVNGEGMGFALAAELNHYPGPRHVLELGDELHLTDEQRRAAQRIFDDMKSEAVQIGNDIVAREWRLDSLFAAATLDDHTLNAALQDIGTLTGMLRYTHLRAHLAMRRVLTVDQIRRYDELRGYVSGPDGRHRHQGGAPPL